MGEYIKNGLGTIQKDFPEIGDIRQAGLHIGVELVRNPETKEPAAEEGVAMHKTAISHGLILGMAGPRKQVLKIKPPLIVNRGECDEILDKFRQSLAAVFRK